MFSHPFKIHQVGVCASPPVSGASCFDLHRWFAERQPQQSVPAPASRHNRDVAHCAQNFRFLLTRSASVVSFNFAVARCTLV